MNWGYRIIIFFSAFVAFMAFMFYKCLQQDFDLVAPDYYAQELAYQEQIDQLNNTQSLNKKPTWEFDDTDFILVFPNTITTGKINFFRPSDDELDQEKLVVLDNQLQQKFDLDQFQQGIYMIKLSWSNNGTDYYMEERVRFP